MTATGQAATSALLEVHGLSVAYPGNSGTVTVVRDVSFSLGPGEMLGVVGESGSGKSTLLRALIGLLPSGGQVTSGEVLLRGENLLGLPESRMRGIRGSQLGMVFQDPVNVLNPSMTIERQLSRILRLHRPEIPRQRRTAEILSVLERVGIDGRGKLGSHPFEFSQGQLQRIMIAVACLAGRPALLLADEPTTSLDVTVEAQIGELLLDLRAELGLAVILVSHDIALVGQLCDRVLVLYGGRLVETASVTTLLAQPGHPYTEQLLRSIPPFPGTGERLYAMRGEIADLAEASPGCVFAPRCESRLGPVCDTVEPARSAISAGHHATCHRYAMPAAPEPPRDAQPITRER
ncbi:MAG TPA: ABC transporter ATP-binding protein [Streptosporangiaceae bacterium]|nr:ABC transporter ATP-binding protein [Streptosporangiaceae bacterium]